jgi:hypothetical protein
MPMADGCAQNWFGVWSPVGLSFYTTLCGRLWAMSDRMSDGGEQLRATSSTVPFGPPATHAVGNAESSVQLTLRYRSPNWSAVIMVTAMMTVLFSVLGFEPVVLGQDFHGDGHTKSLGRIWGAIALVIVWLLFLRVLHVRLVLDERGISIRNFFVRTRQVAWTDVRHVALIGGVVTSPGGYKQSYAKVRIVAAQPITATAAKVYYKDRAVRLKPVIDVCHAHNVSVYDA